MSTSNDAPSATAVEQANVQTVVEARIAPDEDIASNSSVSSSVYEFRVEHGRKYQKYREGSESSTRFAFVLEKMLIEARISLPYRRKGE
ncbi:methyltransferase domain-containing protein [Colletotrichum tofieldiae]|nr:methyltransferase domain-containing protein [Colletotrichum tofieldiae]